MTDLNIKFCAKYTLIQDDQADPERGETDSVGIEGETLFAKSATLAAGGGTSGVLTLPTGTKAIAIRYETGDIGKLQAVLVDAVAGTVTLDLKKFGASNKGVLVMAVEKVVSIAFTNNDADEAAKYDLTAIAP